MSKIEPYKRTLLNIGPIIFRHVFLFVNGVIFSVSILLFIFGNRESAIFIAAITVFNIFLGALQDTRARIALEKLQMLTALRVICINKDGTEQEVLAETVIKGDHVKLRIGDQVPCDGILISSNGLEVSEALITGETDSFHRAKGAAVNAGDVVTTGSAVMETKTDFKDSRVAKLNEEAKKYSQRPSPIQQAINKVIKYAGYILFVVIVYVVARGFFVHESAMKIVLDIGALASMIIPQGLVVITTLLFAFGASTYSKKHVLFQEINATEKLGRIKNLCMDKTGTLTDNVLEVEEMIVREGKSKEDIGRMIASYIHGTNDSSQTIAAVGRYIGLKNISTDFEITHLLPFSSWRQYGAVELHRNSGSNVETVLIGSPDTFMPYFSESKDRGWLESVIEKNKGTGKRILCVVGAGPGVLKDEKIDDSSPLNKSPSKNDLSGSKLSVLAVFVFQSGLRHGVKHAIEFFQKRGVKIRIISGDNVDTVRTVAKSAGVDNTDNFVTGKDMEKWSDEEFDRKVAECTIFARIVPEQKVRIVESLKKNGFTAMVGDGANDALALKKADLGIAMFDGVQATRSLAGVILMKNSFADLPGGVELSDNFIRNIEIFAGMFLNQSILGLFFFMLISIFGYPFPLTPLNITMMNYFAVGIPGMIIGYWAIRPTGKILPASGDNFLKLVLPFAMWSAILQAIAVTIVFLMSPEYLKLAMSNTMVGLAFIVCSLIFFILAPQVYRVKQSKNEKWHLVYLVIFEIILLLVLVQIPFVIRFFNITTPFPTLSVLGHALIVLIGFGIVQYFVTKKFFSNKKTT